MMPRHGYDDEPLAHHCPVHRRLLAARLGAVPYVARGDAADGQRNLVDLVAEQADQRDRADADDAHLRI